MLMFMCCFFFFTTLEKVIENTNSGLNCIKQNNLLNKCFFFTLFVCLCYVFSSLEKVIEK